MIDLIRGENLLVVRSLFQSDGTTPLPHADLESAKVKLIQGGQVKATVVLGEDEFRTGPESDEITLEITSELSLRLVAGELTLRWELRVSDEDFEAEPDVFIDMLEETPITVT